MIFLINLIKKSVQIQEKEDFTKKSFSYLFDETVQKNTHESINGECSFCKAATFKMFS